MLKTKRYCAMKLLSLVQEIHIGSTYEVVDDAVGNLIESLCNALLIQGNNFKLLPKHLEASKHRHNALDRARFKIANVKLYGLYTKELVSQKYDLSIAHLTLKG